MQSKYKANKFQIMSGLVETGDRNMNVLSLEYLNIVIHWHNGAREAHKYYICRK